MQNTSDIEGYSHVCEREKEDENVIWLYAVCSDDTVSDNSGIDALCGPKYGNCEDWGSGEVEVQTRYRGNTGGDRDRLDNEGDGEDEDDQGRDGISIRHCWVLDCGTNLDISAF